MRYIPGNAQDIGTRNYQQDSFGFSALEDQEFMAHAGFLAIVADGMGGMEHGDVASRTAVERFRETYRTKTPDEPIPAALLRSLQVANQAVAELSAQMGSTLGIGTTFIAVAICGRDLHWISVGDSAIYRLREQQLQQLTTPHVFAAFLDKAVERGIMSAEEAARHPERESLTSYVGAKSIEEIDQNNVPLPVRGGDQILLCSDGLFKTVPLSEIQAAMTGRPPQEACEALVQLALSKGREHQDNVTAVVVALEETDEDYAEPDTEEIPAGALIEPVELTPPAPLAPPVAAAAPVAPVAPAPPHIPVAPKQQGSFVTVRGMMLLLVVVILALAALWVNKDKIAKPVATPAPGEPAKQ